MRERAHGGEEKSDDKVYQLLLHLLRLILCKEYLTREVSESAEQTAVAMLKPFLNSRDLESKLDADTELVTSLVQLGSVQERRQGKGDAVTQFVAVSETNLSSVVYFSVD